MNSQSVAADEQDLTQGIDNQGQLSGNCLNRGRIDLERPEVFFMFYEIVRDFYKSGWTASSPSILRAKSPQS
jgi:hypothetical protein